MACLRRLDLVVAGSESTGRIAVQRVRGIEPLVRVINYGVGDSQVPPSWPPLGEGLEVEIGDRLVLLTVGRLIRRKGVAWFVKEVLPSLPGEAVYVVVGDGPDRKLIQEIARERGVHRRLILTGPVDEQQLRALYRRADVFVMPNVKVPDDVEGFGLVALEASMAGLPVIASRIDGITDAVRDGRNGLLVEAENTAAFRGAIERLVAMGRSERAQLGARFREYTRANYSWSQMANEYAKAFESLRSVGARQAQLERRLNAE
jgi:glycosyltransferase involved in cell wall biosynthesis